VRLITLYEAGNVVRFHTKRVIHRQNLAEHSWGVALTLTHICVPSPQLLKAALVHDLAESVTGDVPATAKWDSIELRGALADLEGKFEYQHGINVHLTQEEKQLLRWADMFELVLYCSKEVMMGNSAMSEIMRVGIEYLDALGAPTPEASLLLEQFR